MEKKEELSDVMSSSVLEIVELSTGEIVLRKIDDDSEPLVKIQFSEEAKLFLGDTKAGIGRAMLGAGVQLVSRIYDQEVLAEAELETLH